MAETERFKDLQTEIINEVEEEEKNKAEKSPVSEILNIRKSSKKKQTAFRIDEVNYARFTTICQKMGVTASSQINLMITQFNKEHEDYLDI